MTNSKCPYKYTDVDEMPERRGSGAPGRWDWLRDVVIDELMPSLKTRRFEVPNKKEALLMQSAAQGASSTTKYSFGKQLPDPYKVRTAKEPIKSEDGPYYVWVGVVKP